MSIRNEMVDDVVYAHRFDAKSRTSPSFSAQEPALLMNGTKVIGPQSAAVTHASGSVTAEQFNDLLGKLEAHGLLATPE